MDLRFRGELYYWRGPAPYHFVAVPPAEAELIAEVAPRVTYGWGMIPVELTVGLTTVTTSLWPQDGGYIVPIKRLVRDEEDLDVGDMVEVRLHVAS